MRSCGERARILAFTAAALLLPSGSQAIAPIPSPLHLAVGVFGFRGLPLAQQDAASGPLYGLKARAGVYGPLAAELSFTRFKEGDVHFTADGRDQIISG